MEAIAIGECLCRLTSKCLAFSTRPTALPHFPLPHFLPNQLGVGVKGGCEAIINAVSSHFSSSPSDRCWTLLVDFSIASIGEDVSRVPKAHSLSLPLDRSLLLQPAQPFVGKPLPTQLQRSSTRGSPWFCPHTLTYH